MLQVSVRLIQFRLNSIGKSIESLEATCSIGIRNCSNSFYRRVIPEFNSGILTTIRPRDSRVERRSRWRHRIICSRLSFQGRKYAGSGRADVKREVHGICSADLPMTSSVWASLDMLTVVIVAAVIASTLPGGDLPPDVSTLPPSSSPHPVVSKSSVLLHRAGSVCVWSSSTRSYGLIRSRSSTTADCMNRE